MLSSRIIISRISRIFLTAIVAAQVITGLRLYWFSSAASGPIAELINSLTPGGQILIWHYYLGLLFIAVCGFDLVYHFILGSGERAVVKFSLLVEALILIGAAISGLARFQSWWVSAEIESILKICHIVSVMLLVPLIILLLIVSFRSEGSPKITFGSNRMVTIAAGMALLAAIVYCYGASLGESLPTLTSKLINKSINIDGIISSREWSSVPEIVIPVAGGNPDQNPVSEVRLRSFHNRRQIFFLIRWSDSTRSYNRQLLKKDHGWVELASEVQDQFGERFFYEDQLAISFSKNKNNSCLNSCHLNSGSAGLKRAGLHYIESADTVDLWKWQSVSSNAGFQADDGYWAGYLNDSLGGRQNDNDTRDGSMSNLNQSWLQPYFFPFNPYDQSAIWVGSGQAIPYFDLKDTFSIGSTVPSVLVTRLIGDRSETAARGAWFGGQWTLELVRNLRTGSPLDVTFRDTVYMSIATFDNAEKKHSYHMIPIRLIIE